MKLLFVASECVPFSKTGGLADVAGALPKELARQGIDARVITPLYRTMPDVWRAKLEHVLFFYVNLGWRRQYVGVERLVMDGVTYYFIDNEYYFGRSYIYGVGSDEGERFAFFCRAVLEALPHIDFIPDVMHLNDWQTGLIAPMLEVQYRVLPLYKTMKTVFTIHNLQFQGVFQIDQIEELLTLGYDMYTSDKLEFYGQCSFMKGGLTYSNKITTVSPTYASEIQTPYYGERLDGLLRARSRDLTGILNGIDTDEYDPAHDPTIHAKYSGTTFDVKAKNKLALQRELMLEEGAEVPMIAMISRLSGQKGFDLVDRVLDGILATGTQLVVLGMGEDKFVDLFNWAQWKYAGRVAARFEMNAALAHRVYAAADMFLMPSLFEPCGLSQLISLRYGTLPITRETGGLRDTVLSYNQYTGDGNGFTFLNYNAHDMLTVVERAVGLYVDDPTTWQMIAKRAMTGQYGWDQSAKKYITLYEDLITGKPAPKKRAPKKPAQEKAPVKKPATKSAAKKPATVKTAAERKPIEKPAPKKPRVQKKVEEV